MNIRLFSAIVAISPSMALAEPISGTVNMSGRFYVDADLALNAASQWPGSMATLGSGPGAFEYQLHSRINKLGSISEQWDDQFLYPRVAGIEHRVLDGVGVHRFPQGFLRANDPMYPWDPTNPAITALATSSLDRWSGRLSNEFGDVAGWHRGEVNARSFIRPNTDGRFAESSGRFIDVSTFEDNSNDQGDYRARRVVKETWGSVASEVVNPFARRLAKAYWDNTLVLDIRDPQNPPGSLFSATVETERWATQGQAGITLMQGRNSLGSVYPNPQESATLVDPALYVSTLRLESIIIDPADRPALHESHSASLSVATLYQDVSDTFPDQSLHRFEGTVEIVNGDFTATGDFAQLNWQFETLASEIIGFDMLVATVDLQTPWGFNMDFATLFSGTPSLEFDLTTTQNWYTLAVPAPSGMALAGVVFAFGWRRVRRS